jgi:hypothetical protein
MSYKLSDFTNNAKIKYVLSGIIIGNTFSISGILLCIIVIMFVCDPVIDVGNEYLSQHLFKPNSLALSDKQNSTNSTNSASSIDTQYTIRDVAREISYIVRSKLVLK